MHDEKTRRLLFKLRPKLCTFDELIVTILERVTGTGEFTGPRPAGYLENEAQKLLGARKD